MKVRHRQVRGLFSNLKRCWCHAGSMKWTTHKESSAAPPACSSHSMTNVGQHGIYSFGGEGRRLSNWVYALDPDTCKWRQVNTLGVS